MVLWDPDRVDEGEVFMHTNMGWIPVEVEPAEGETVLVTAMAIAKQYGLKETSRERAIWAAGGEGFEDSYEE